MALWQYDFYLIPEHLRKQKEIDSHNIDDFDISINIKENTLKSIENVLHPSNSWSTSIRQYGDIDGTCIELYIKDSNIKSIQVRLDLTSLTGTQLDVLIQFAKDNNLNLLLEDSLFDANREDIENALKESKAFRFVKDPRSFLSKL